MRTWTVTNVKSQRVGTMSCCCCGAKIESGLYTFCQKPSTGSFSCKCFSCSKDVNPMKRYINKQSHDQNARVKINKEIKDLMSKYGNDLVHFEMINLIEESENNEEIA